MVEMYDESQNVIFKTNDFHTFLFLEREKAQSHVQGSFCLKKDTFLKQMYNLHHFRNGIMVCFILKRICYL